VHWLLNLVAILLYALFFGGSTMLYNGPTWSLVPMSLFVLAFPYIDAFVSAYSAPTLFRLMGLCSVASCAMIAVAGRAGLFWKFYAIVGFLYWAPCFIFGVAVAQIFRRRDAEGRNCPRFWGRVSDAMTLGFAVVLVAVYYNPCHMYGGTPVNLPFLKWFVRPFDKPQGLGISCNASDFVAMENSPTPTDGYGVFSPRLDVIMAALSWFQAGTPFLAVWVYGLAVGGGLTARLLSQSWLAHGLAPLAYGVYFAHVPVAWLWYFITRGIPEFEWWHEFVPLYPFPIAWQEALLVLGFSFGASWAWDRYANAIVLPALLKFLLWFFGEMAEPVEGVFPLPEPETPPHGENAARHSGVPNEGHRGSEEAALPVLQEAIRNVTGATVSADTSLHFVGLDSFGTSALVGLLRAQLSQAQDLTAAKLFELGTVGKLADHLSASSLESVALLDN